MPLYEYYCSKCQKVSEYLQKFDAAPPEECSLCHSAGPMSKQISQAAFQLKGTGWYVTDFKNPQKGNAKAPASEAADSSASSESKGESPAEAKSGTAETGASEKNEGGKRDSGEKAGGNKGHETKVSDAGSKAGAD